MSYIGKGIESVTFNTATTFDVTGNITVGGTVDGRDVATDGTKLDTITSGAIADIVQDTTPQLGGNLDLNTNDIIGTGNINVTGSVTGTSFVSTGNMSFTNNSKAIFGTSPSLEIYHDGSNSILDDVGAGNFKMQLSGSDKLEITSTGVDVTGTVTADGLTVDGDVNVTSALPKIQFTDTTGSYQSRLILNDTEIQLDNQSTGGIRLRTDGYKSRFLLDSNGDISFYDSTGVSQGLFYQASTQRLGLGTTSPDLTLDVSHNVSSEYVATFQNTADNLELKIGTTSGLLNIQGANASTNAAYNIALNAEGGNVGIGTSSPSRQLEIYDDGTNGQAVLALTAQNTENSRIMFADPDDNNIGIIDYNHSDDSMRFSVNNSERLRIDSSGKFLINTTSGTGVGNFKVNCSGGGSVGGANPTPSAMFDYSVVGGGGSFNVLALHYNPSTVGNGAALTFSGSDSSGDRYTTGLISATLTDNTSSSPSGALVFHTANAGSVAERMRIDSSGTVIISGNGGSSTNSLDLSYSGSSGQATIQADSNGGDTFLTFGTSLSGSVSERMRIDASGRVTMPYQPSFSVSRNQGDVSSGTYVFPNAYHNTGNHYSTTTGRFTAPITGLYFFSTNMMSSNAGTYNNSYYEITKNGSGYQRVYSSNGTSVHHRWNWSGVIYLAAGDYISVDNPGGSSLVLYGGSNEYTTFTGFLVG